MIENIEEITEKVRKYVKKAVNQPRYEHSVRTAETCAKLCKKYGFDEKMGYLAGISHDMCKKLSPDEMLQIVAKDGKTVSELEKANPSLLHGRAAAVKLQDEFDVHEPELIEAVANHTFGKKGLCPLGKILYISDKIEPGREHVNDAYMKSIKNLSLDELFYKVVSDSKAYLLKKGKKIAPETEELLKYLEAGGV